MVGGGGGGGAGGAAAAAAAAAAAVRRRRRRRRRHRVAPTQAVEVAGMAASLCQPGELGPKGQEAGATAGRRIYRVWRALAAVEADAVEPAKKVESERSTV
jgi:hypothetical protein